MRNLNGRWIEWLAVVGCVGFGLAILFPVAGLARGRGKADVCMANLYILGQAWLAYAEDFDGRLVGGSNYYSGSGATPYRWVERPLYKPTDDPEKNPVPTNSELTLEYGLNGIRAGRLYPYIQDTRAYHCPADPYSVRRASKYVEYRVYTISGLMNGEDVGRTISFPTGTKTLINAKKMLQIHKPAERYVFLEEDAVLHGQAYTMGSFVLMSGWNSDAWWDWPASFHPDRGVLGFADGHVGWRRWTDPRTISLITTGMPSIVQPNNADLQWMVQGYMPNEP
jgi:prepilin-type processing-associated H-X9-DG protein